MSMYIDSNVRRFFDMLKGIDDLSSIGNGVPYGDIRQGDLLFIDRKQTQGDGFIYLAKVNGEESPQYNRLYWTGGTITFCHTTDGEIKEVHPAEDVTIEGRVTGIYRELPAVPMVDPGKYRSMIDQIKKVDAGNYRMTDKQAEAIRTQNRGYPMWCIFDAFRWGFIRGQRAEKARAKKRRGEGGAA